MSALATGAAAMLPGSAAAQARPHGRVAFGLTRRTLLLLLLGGLWLIPAFFLRGFLFALLAWDVLVLLLALLDGLRLPGASALTVERRWLALPTLGGSVAVELALTQRGIAPVEVILLDDLPPRLAESPPRVTLTAWPRECAQGSYSFEPRERGDAVAGRVYLRYRSHAGLCERWAVAELPQTVRVYPRSAPAGEGELFLARARQIDREMRKLRLRGQGRDFESLREYREGGDDLREVCWTATARRGALVCRQYRMERSQPVWLVLDAGRLLGARSGSFSRLDSMVASALAVARLALLSGDRVGLLAYGRGIRQRVPLGRAQGTLRSLMEATATIAAEPGEADHLLATATLSRMQPTRSLVLWFTDLSEAAMRPEVVDGAAQLLHRHLVLFVVPEHEELVQVADKRPENVSAMFERAAAQEMLGRRELLLRRLRERGALTIQTPPGRIEAAVLNRYLEIKERGLL